MYKNKDKQREANKEHAKAYRKRKGMTLGYDDNTKGMTHKAQGMTLVKAIEGGHTPTLRGHGVERAYIPSLGATNFLETESRVQH